MIVSEDHGQDLGCYGNEVVYTPVLDSLAANGIRFVNAYTTYSVCSPSRSSIFTGLYPHQNGQIGLATHNFRMYDNFENIPEYLKSKGYRTGCLGKLHVNPESAIPFDFHELQTSNFSKNNLQSYAAKAAQFVRSDEGPFLLMVNFPDAHYPLLREVEGLPTKVVTGEDVSATLPFVGANTRRLRELTADYYSQINRLDECIGMLLDSLIKTGKTESMLTIYLSDHGAQFSRGKTTNYEGGLKIPMIMHWPGSIGEHQVIQDPMVSVIDLFPTIIDVLGESPNASLPGESLLTFMRTTSEIPEWREYLFADGAIGTAKYFYPRRSVRDARFKLIHNLYFPEPDPYFTVYTDQIYPQMVSGTSRDEIKSLTPQYQQVYDRWENPPEYELYDLSNDPWEFVDLSAKPEYQDELERLKEILKDWQIQTHDPLADTVLFQKLKDEVNKVNQDYPNHGYQKDPEFSWNYPDYFGEYVLEKNK